VHPFFSPNLSFAVLSVLRTQLAKNSGVRLRVEVSFGCRWTYLSMDGQLVEYVTHSGRVRQRGILPLQIYSAHGLTKLAWMPSHLFYYLFSAEVVLISLRSSAQTFFSWHRLTRFSFLAVFAMSTHSSLFFSSASACDLPVLCPVNEPQRQPIGEARLRGAHKNARVQHHRKLIVPGKRALD